jgi:hypothetical protein
MAFSLNKNSLVPALKYVADTVMSLVEKLGVNSVDLPHALRQVAVRCFDDKMVVVVHKAVGMADPVEFPVGPDEKRGTGVRIRCGRLR